jgi:hypothetical protein
MPAAELVDEQEPETPRERKLADLDAHGGRRDGRPELAELAGAASGGEMIGSSP